MRRVFRPLRDYPPFWLGVVGIVVLVVAVAAATAFGELGLDKSEYQAEFANSGGLRPNDEVRVAGLEIGTVASTELEGDHVLVTFRIDNGVDLGADTQASIKLSTLLGGRYLELRPAGRGELRHDRIPLAHTTVPYDLSQIIQDGTPLAENLDGDVLRRAAGAVSENLKQNGDKIGPALDGLTRLSAVVDARRDQFSHLLTSLTDVTTLVDQRSDQIFALMGQSDGLLKILLQRRDTIRGLIGNVASVTDELNGALAENQGRVGPLLDNATKLTDLLREQNDAVDRGLQLLGPTPRYLDNAAGNGPYLEIYLPYSIVPDNILCRVHAVSGCR